MGLTLVLHTFVGVLIGLQLSLVHRSHGVLLPLEPPPLNLSLGGISVRLDGRSWQLILTPHRQSYALMDPFVERHLTADVHAAHIGAEVLPPGWHRGLLRPAGGLYGVLVHPLYRSGLWIVR